MKKLTLISVIILAIVCTTTAQIINIPGDYPSIQEGIDAAVDGDTVLIAEGVYYENLTFNGKAITLASYFLIDEDQTHIDSTIIDGSQAANRYTAYAVYFINDEDSTSILTGFTLRFKAFKLQGSEEVIGGGIYLHNTFPKVIHNQIIGHVETQGSKKRPKTFITWVYLGNPRGKEKGCLYSVNDSSLAVIPNVFMKQDDPREMEFLLLNVNQIDKIYIRNKKSQLAGVLIGALCGLLIGGASGLAAGDDPPCSSSSWFCVENTAQQKAIIRGVPFAIAGAGIGLAIGSFKIKIPINGDVRTYKKTRKRLKAYSVN